MSAKKSGRVVQIRINPEDCMSVVDVALRSGMPVGKCTFPVAVSQALKVLLQMHRDAGNIPTRDGFEYSDVMRGVLTDNREMPMISVDNFRARCPTQTHVIADNNADVSRESVKVELAELAQRRENEDPNWSEDDETRYQTLVKIYYGE